MFIDLMIIPQAVVDEDPARRAFMSRLTTASLGVTKRSWCENHCQKMEKGCTTMSDQAKKVIKKKQDRQRPGACSTHGQRPVKHCHREMTSRHVYIVSVDVLSPMATRTTSSRNKQRAASSSGSNSSRRSVLDSQVQIEGGTIWKLTTTTRASNGGKLVEESK